MNRTIGRFHVALILSALPAFNPQSATAMPFGTAFTYQGCLNDGTNPAAGIFDFRFSIFDSAINGNAAASPLTNNSTAVGNGRFTVTLDFGAGAFNGDARWLEIAVRTNGAATFTPLAPRQPLTPAPYALQAANVPASGIGPGTANINISGYAAGAASAANFTGPLAGDVTGTQAATTVERLRGAQVSPNAPAANQHLRFDGTRWVPSAVVLETDVGGTLADARLTTNVALLNARQVFTGSNTFNGVVTATNPANAFNGTFTGSGALLSGITAGQVSGLGNAAVANTNTMTVYGSINARNVTGNGTYNGVPIDPGITNLGTMATMNANSAFNLSNPNNIIASAWTYGGAQGTFDTPPRGTSGWYGGITLTNEACVLTLFTNMVLSGMVQNGWNWFLWDVGPDGPGAPNTDDTIFQLETNDVPYPALTNGFPGGWMDADPSFYPDGAAYIIQKAHGMGIRVILYVYNGAHGNASFLQGTNDIRRAQPGILGTQYYLGWLSNAICVWGLDGIKDERSGSDFTNAVAQQAMILACTRQTGRPFYVNVATPSGYQGWYKGLFNSWRIGVGVSGDVTGLAQYYQWLNTTPFWVSEPGSFNDEDEMHGGMWTDTALMKNQLVTDTMLNAPILQQFIETSGPRYEYLHHGLYYDPWDNPNINGIGNDFSHHVSIVYSNANMVVFDKVLADGTHNIAVQNQSFSTSGSVTLPVTNFYPGLYPPVCTYHDCFTNAPQFLATNAFTLTVQAHDIQWFNLVPGVEQPFRAGTNWLAYFPWSKISYGWCASPIQVNRYGSTYGIAVPYVTLNGQRHDTLLFVATYPYAYTNTIDWLVNGNGTTFSATFQNQNGVPGQMATYSVLGDGATLWTAQIGNNRFTNVSVNIAGINDLQISMGSPFNFATVIGSPMIYCATQAKTDSSGRTSTTVDDPTKVPGYVFTGNGSGLANLSANAVVGGITANVAVLTPGAVTKILCFTNGILRAVK